MAGVQCTARMIRRLLTLALVASAACGEPPANRDGPGQPRPGDLPLRGTKTIAPMPRPDVVLRDTDGRAWDFRAETEGRTTLLFFGYTYCPDICPIHMATLAAALGDADVEVHASVDVVFVTVDPERDTPERLHGWLATFDSSFVGLTGTPEVLAEALAHFRYPPPERSGAGPVYTVGHPALVYAFTPDGLTHVMYGPDTPVAVWRHDLGMLHAFPWDEVAAVGAPEGAATSGLSTSGSGTAGATEGAIAGAPTATPGGAARVGDIAVTGAWIPAPPPGSPAALYLTIANLGTSADTLTGLSTTLAAEATLHRMTTVGGMTRMEPLANLPLPGGDTVRLLPGAFHGMFSEPDRARFQPGATVGVRLVFARAGAVDVAVPVRSYDGGR